MCVLVFSPPGSVFAIARHLREPRRQVGISPERHPILTRASPERHPISLGGHPMLTRSTADAVPTDVLVLPVIPCAPPHIPYHISRALCNSLPHDHQNL